MALSGWRRLTGNRDSTIGNLSVAHEAFTYGIFLVIQEFLEMAGIVSFLNGLMSYLVSSEREVGGCRP